MLSLGLSLGACTQSEPIEFEVGDTPAAGAPNDSECVPSEVDRSPHSVVEVVALINALPKPLTLPCFLESLERPLALNATRGTFSAQPATGSRSPRMFLFFDPLILTVVPEGSGAHLLEMSELLSVKRSVKAEVKFPVLKPLENRDPFEGHMFDDEHSNCALCHAGETLATQIDFARAFTSQALRPLYNERVMTESLLVEYQQCDVELEPERCSMFEALFGHGEVTDRAFPEEMDTFF